MDVLTIDRKEGFPIDTIGVELETTSHSSAFAQLLEGLKGWKNKITTGKKLFCGKQRVVFPLTTHSPKFLREVC